MGLSEFPNKTKELPEDRFLWGLIFLPGSIFFGMMFIGAVKPGSDTDLFIPLLLIGLPALLIWLIYVLIRLCVEIFRKLPKRALSTILSVAVFSFFILVPRKIPFLPQFISKLRGMNELNSIYDSAQKKIKQAPSERQTFKLESDGFAHTVSTDRSIIYDPTDAIVSENELRDAEMKEQCLSTYKGKEYYHCWLETIHLRDHFYYVLQWYQ